MASQLNPYLNFPGTARAAMTRYQQIFGGDLQILTFGQFGAEGPGADGVMHAHLETDAGFVLMASDLPPGYVDEGVMPSSMHVSVSGDDARLRDYWNGLTEGAEVTMPLERQMWGGQFGALTDRFGVSWMVNIGKAEPALS
ncbi:VOC family protein [Phycicoccus sp. CSK15P-2]|uniref:VOC family protein n=1 Tax=Phycicoccus sp. CSK15P-2 TaxID=2807627 RepID=UPI0019505AE8|nr:VOC family protein [Phycicoccus sp. CSK15P-2]MBM6405316.1 VOC family protein [Phycicoccus sp. CSK15P-2]